MLTAVILDADTLGNDVDLGPIRDVVDKLAVYGSTSDEELAGRVAGADLILTNKVSIPAAAMGSCRGILILATGTNNVDLEVARQRQIPVLNVDNYGTRSVAQHTLMLILALAARLPLHQRDLVRGAWQHSQSFCLQNHPSIGLNDKNMVLVGAGNIGTAVADLVRALGMNVRFSARPGKVGDSRPPLQDLLAGADVVSFHCPLNDKTHHLLDAGGLARIKPGCLVVNCARGGVINEEAALEALKAGRLGGLAVDVLPEEPPAHGHPVLAALVDRLNLIVTPHNSWTTREARQKIITLTAQNIQRLASGTAL